MARKLPQGISLRFLAFVFAIITMLWVAGTAPSAHAQTWAATTEQAPIEQLIANWPHLAPKQQFAAIEQLLHAGEFDTAGRLLANTRYDFPGDRAIARFYQGLVLRGQGKGAEAAAILREVLAQHPEFTRVRLELAQTLFAIHEDESARHNFELVLGGAAGDTGLQKVARSYINAIEARRAWDFTSFLTVAPSTNINRGPDLQTIDIAGLPTLKLNSGKSGVGVNGGFHAGYRLAVTDRLDFVVAGGAQTRRFEDPQMSDTLVSASAGPKLKFENGFIGVFGTADHRWIADAGYATNFGGLISGGYSPDAANLLSADVGCTQRTFSDDWLGADQSYQNGYGCFYSGRYDHYFNSTTYLRVIGSAGFDRTRKPHLDNESAGAGLGLYHEFGWGLSLYAQGMYTRTGYNGNYEPYKWTRQDKRYDASVSLTKRDFEIFGLAPMLQYTFTHNDSNVPLTAFDEQGLALTLTKRF